jgi:hypothetical protein
MRRTQIQLDEETHAALRRLAYERGTSLASVIRDALDDSLGKRPGKRKRPPRKVDDFPFVGAGRSNQKRLAPVSERHDEALADALSKKTR